MSEQPPFPRWLLWIFVVVLVGGLVFALRGVLAPIFFALLIAYMLDPVVDWIEERGFLRGAAIGVLLTMGFVVTAILVVVLVPMILHDVSDFVQRLPSMVATLRADWEPRLAEYGIVIPASVADAFGQLHLDAQDLLKKSAKPIMAVVRWLAGGTVSVVGAAFAFVVIPVLAFYLLYDFDDLVESAGRLVPPRFRHTVFGTVGDIDNVLGHFFRGQLTVMAILALLYSLGYGIIGVPLAVPIGLTAGVISFIPYVGGAVALGLALLMTLLDWTGWSTIVLVVLVYAIIQALEGFVITPKIMGDKVGLSPVVILVALMIGGELLGFAGVLLAIPAAAVLKIFMHRGVDWYLTSDFFGAAPQ